ncbi:MAG: hypothetical protein WCV84_02100 [Patescibacteria group bacterium]
MGLVIGIVLVILIVGFAIWFQFGTVTIESDKTFKLLILAFFLMYIGAAIGIHFIGTPLAENARLSSIVEELGFAGQDMSF